MYKSIIIKYVSMYVKFNFKGLYYEFYKKNCNKSDGIAQILATKNRNALSWLYFQSDNNRAKFMLG